MLPGAAYYIYLILKDSKLREHHLVTNTLPLDPVWMWLITLLPLIIACIWLLWKKIQINSHKNIWVYVWLISAIICIMLPLPWSRKFTQALLPALVLITLPFWLNIYDNLKPKTDKIIKISLAFLLFFPFLHILQSQFGLATDPAWNRYFYVDKQTQKAWDILKMEPNNSLVISTDLYTNLWTPAYTGKYVWIGHNHETPDFINRFNDYKNWRNNESAIIFNDFLKNKEITHVLTHNNKYSDLFNGDWRLIFHEENISVWKK